MEEGLGSHTHTRTHRVCAVTWVVTARLTNPKIKTLKTSLSQQVYLLMEKAKKKNNNKSEKKW